MEMLIKDAVTKEVLLEKKYKIQAHNFCHTGKTHSIHTQNNQIDSKVIEHYTENSVLVFGTMNIKRDIYIDMYSETPLYEMHFCMNGHSAFKTAKSNVDFNKNQHNLYSYQELQGLFKQHENTNEYMEVIFTQEYIQQLTHSLEELIPKPNKANYQLFGQNATVTNEMKRIITEMYNTNRCGVLQQMYLDIKSKELLLLQLEQYIHQNTLTTPPKLTVSDKQKLAEAKELIELNYQTPLSLSQLAIKVGLNEYKLKKGFKEEYKATVFGYVYQLRMEQAHTMLVSTDIPIKEIANYCGYEYVQHFTTAFKRMYNTTPALYRKS